MLIDTRTRTRIERAPPQQSPWIVSEGQVGTCAATQDGRSSLYGARRDGRVVRFVARGACDRHSKLKELQTGDSANHVARGGARGCAGDC